MVITGQVGTGDMRGDLPVKQRGFQEVDTVELMKPITKAAFLVKDVRDLPDVMEQAFFLARSGRQGPVVVDLPMNVQRGACDETAFRADRQAHRESCPLCLPTRSRPWRNGSAKPQRPVILAGGGVIASGAHAGTARAGRQVSHSGDHEHARHGRLSVRQRRCRWACAAMPAANMPIWRCTSPIF